MKQKLIEQAWENREFLKDSVTIEAIRSVIEQLDKGQLRIAEQINSHWHVNEWVKKAVLLFF